MTHSRLLAPAALAFAATMSLAGGAQAATVTVTGSSLTSAERLFGTTVAYVVDLVALGFTNVSSVTLIDDNDGSTPQGTAGYDLDGIGLFDADPTGPFPLNAVPPTEFATFASTSDKIGTSNSFDKFDGVNSASNYLSIGDTSYATVPSDVGDGTFTAFGPSGGLAVGIGSNQFLVTQDVGGLDRLGSIEITGSSSSISAPVPLPAAGLLLLAGIGGLGAFRKFRKA